MEKYSAKAVISSAVKPLAWRCMTVAERSPDLNACNLAMMSALLTPASAGVESMLLLTETALPCVPWQAAHDAARLLICTLYAATESAAQTVIGLKSPMTAADMIIFFKQYSLKYCQWFQP